MNLDYSKEPLDVGLFIHKNGDVEVNKILQYIYRYLIITQHGLFYRSDPGMGGRWDLAPYKMLKDLIPLKRYRVLWKNHAKMHPVQIDTFDPPGEQYNRDGWIIAANFWDGFNIQPSNKPDAEIFEIVTPWLFHLYFCWCLYQQDLFIKILDHFCSIFRNPTQRTRRHVFLKTTKSNWLASDCWDTVFKPFTFLSGYKYLDTDVVENKKLNKDNYYWCRSFLLLIAGDFDNPNKAFKLLESDEFVLRCEGDKPYKIKNVMNLFFGLNDNVDFDSKFENIVLNVDDKFFHKRSLDYGFLNKYFDTISKTPCDALIQFLLTCSADFMKNIKFQQDQKGVPDLSLAKTNGEKILEYATKYKKPRLN